MIKEIYKDIKNYIGEYQISNFGNIKSIKNKYNPIILKQSVSSNTYISIQLLKKGKRKNILVHRLVAEAFIKNPLNKKTVNHIDGNKLNNHVSNLEWCTQSENCKHAYKNKLSKISNKLKQVSCKRLRKLTFKQAEEIRELYKKGNTTYYKLSKKFGVDYVSIHQIVKYKSYKIESY